MPSYQSPPVVAVINSSPDIVDILRRALEPAGMVAVTTMTFQIREGTVDIERFVEQHDPAVIVYDVAPPYDANWNLFTHITSRPGLAGIPIVLTSVNAAQVEALAGRDTRIYEIVGKPYDLDLVARAVKEASRSRPTS